MDLTPVEIRVLGCLIEKQRTTPDAYPLSLNGLRAACNQATSRDPVVEYDESVIREALTRLGRRRYTRLASSQGSRAAKFRHLLDETLGLSVAEQAVLAVLMLRGSQTPGELRARTERMHHLPDSGALQSALERLIERGLVARLGRRPGQKEERYAQHLGGRGGGDTGGGSAESAADPAAAGAAAGGDAGSGAPAAAPASADSAGVDRLERLERRIEELSAEVAELRAALEGAA